MFCRFCQSVREELEEDDELKLRPNVWAFNPDTCELTAYIGNGGGCTIPLDTVGATAAEVLETIVTFDEPADRSPETDRCVADLVRALDDLLDMRALCRANAVITDVRTLVKARSLRMVEFDEEES